jgi:hypothetical protein
VREVQLFLERESDSVGAFLTECTVQDVNSEVSKRTLRARAFTV